MYTLRENSTDEQQEEIKEEYLLRHSPNRDRVTAKEPRSRKELGRGAGVKFEKTTMASTRIKTLAYEKRRAE